MTSQQGHNQHLPIQKRDFNQTNRSWYTNLQENTIKKRHTSFFFAHQISFKSYCY